MVCSRRDGRTQLNVIIRQGFAMTDHEHQTISLSDLSADRQSVEELYAHDLISRAARHQALGILHPRGEWVLWSSRLLLFTGTALVLAGLIYFFAFNWAKLGPGIKLGAIELGILGCGLAYLRMSAEHLSAKVILLCASMLVGIFLVVFGQIYQTGADAYQLFMMWSILISGWVLISRFAAHWILWVVVVNLFAVLYWDQGISISRDSRLLICSYLALLNGVVLGAREWAAERGMLWVSGGWNRLVLVVGVLGYLLIPLVMFVTGERSADYGVIVGALFGLVAHALFIYVYRYRIADIWVLAVTILSACIVIECAVFHEIHEIFGFYDATAFLMMSVATVVVFTLAIVILRTLANRLEVHRD